MCRRHIYPGPIYLGVKFVLHLLSKTAKRIILAMERVHVLLLLQKRELSLSTFDICNSVFFYAL